MVDAGADAVLGNHPHWIQNAEAYNGALIVYSMGNLIFDQQFNQEVTRSAMIDMTIALEYSEDLQQYLDIAEQCSVFKDDCLEQIANSGVARPEPTLTYDVIATRTTDLVTSRDDAGLASAKERLNWDAVMTALGLQ